MSSARHALVLGVGLQGFGNRPLATPAHQVLLLTGINVNTWLSLKNPDRDNGCFGLIVSCDELNFLINLD